MASKTSWPKGIVKPEVGHRVEVTWVDSGIYSSRTECEIRDLECMEMVELGVVIEISDKSLKILPSFNKEMPLDMTNGTVYVIWIAAIRDLKILIPQEKKRRKK